MTSSAAVAAAAATDEDVRTILVLDIDGVLNVAVKDMQNGAVNIDRPNLTAARALKTSNIPDSAQMAARMLSTGQRGLEPFGETVGFSYGTFVAEDTTGVADCFGRRFAKLCQMAGNNRMVVLSSSWRAPEHSQMVKRLECLISKYMAEPFVFDSMTAIQAELSPMDRLATIGDFLQTYKKNVDPTERSRVIVFDDLYGTPMIDVDEEVNSVSSTENYLKILMGAGGGDSLKFIHTFDEWEIQGGADRVQVGSGLTMTHYREASAFLRAAPPAPARRTRNRNLISL